MSEDCDFGITRMPIHSETRIGGIHCPEKCRSLKFLEPGHYYPANTPLVKVAAVPGVSRAYYRKWAPGDTRIDGIRLCDVDATNWPATGCEVYICIAAKQVPSPLLCWPEGTSAADINAVRDDEGCCITLQGVPCIPHDNLPCVPQTDEKVHAGGTQTDQAGDQTGTGDEQETGGEGGAATEQKGQTAPPAYASAVPGALIHQRPKTPAEQAKQAAIAASVLTAQELAVEQANMARAMRAGAPV